MKYQLKKEEKIYIILKKGKKQKKKKIISERNQKIKSKEYEGDYEKYFLIIEYEIPFFSEDFEEYGDLFEFMDIPGLNESNTNTSFKKANKNENN